MTKRAKRVAGLTATWLAWPGLLLAHPGHGIDAPAHLHGWEVAAVAILVVTAAGAVTLLARAPSRRDER